MKPENLFTNISLGDARIKSRIELKKSDEGQTVSLRSLTALCVLIWAVPTMAQDSNLPPIANPSFFDVDPDDGNPSPDGNPSGEEKKKEHDGSRALLTAEERIALGKLTRLGAAYHDLAASKRRFAVGEIDLRDASGIEQCLEELVHLDGLESLTLEGCQIGDREIGHLPLRLVLCDLNLNSTLITDDGVKMICRIRSLQNLSFANTEITGEGLVNLSRLPNLVSLNLNQTQIDDNQLMSLGELPSLESLQIRQTPVVGWGLECLTELKQLRELDLTDSRTTDVAIKFISEVPQLCTLILEGTRITDSGLKSLKAKESLRLISLGRTALTSKSLSSLGKFHNLNILELNQLPGLDDLSGLVELHSLTKISLQASPVTDDALASLAALRDLRFLSLSETRVTGEGLRHLTKLSNLRDLRLATCPLGSGAAEHLAELTSLERLVLRDTSFGDADLEHLCSLPELRILDLTGTKLTDASLSTLIRLQRLQFLCLGESRLSDASLGKIENELVFCRVIRTRQEADEIPEEPWTSYIPHRSAPVDDDVPSPIILQISEVSGRERRLDSWDAPATAVILDDQQTPVDALAPVNDR